MRPLLLDVYCGAGGAGMGYYSAGFDVVGVDINPQPSYPFDFIQADAIDYLRHLARRKVLPYQVIHASPPCQGYIKGLNAANAAMGRGGKDRPLLIARTRKLLQRTGLPYVIENVADAREAMLEPVRICGTGLDLPLRRHRLFESNVPLHGIPCQHQRFSTPRYWSNFRPYGWPQLSTVVQVYGNAGGREFWSAAMGIDWMTYDEMREAIPPAYAEHIGKQVIP